MKQFHDIDGNDWRLNAACRDEDPELFFAPEREYKLARSIRTATALKICGRCVVQSTCREWAIDTGQQYGIWGNLSEKDLQVKVARRHNAEA